jgi:DNA polymerase-3 subunit chi
MTRIHFYQVTGRLESALSLIPRLADKALRRHLDVLVHSDDTHRAALADRQLAGSGLPLSAVSVSCDGEPGQHYGLLINLADTVPDWFSRFERLVEIVYDDSTIVLTRRQNYRFYRDRGYPLHYHDLSQSN